LAELQICADCGHDNAPGQAFCGACGQPLSPICPSCGEKNPSTFRFCGACGSEMAPTAPIAAALEGERRWVTVLFGDLAGFTQMSEAADPEDVRLMVDGCTTRMGEIVERYGGWVDKVIGDALMAVFGAPVSHEDDAERAVRAGLELQDYATKNAHDLGGLSLRVGIDTGEVMFAPVGPKDDRRLTVIGDTVNTASRLQALAPEGGVLIGEETECACRDTILCEPLEPIAVKGKSMRLPVWLAEEAIEAAPSEAAPSGPILGREAELDLLRGAWDRVAELRQPQLVTLLGSPGIGKTRLCRELVGLVEEQGGRVVRGRSLPYGESSGYGGFARLVRSLGGIRPTDPPNQARDKLRLRIEGLGDVPAPESVLTHVSLLAGFGEEGVGDRSVLFASARDFIEGVAREQATLFVFEDVHWADPSLLDLIEWLAVHVRDVPAMFLASARGELLDARPHWGGGIPRHTAVSLEALSAEDARALAVRLLPEAPGPESAAERIEQAAGGNPLFIEELAAATAEGTTESAEQLPVAIRAIITARLDALPSLQRRLVHDASVAGGVFTRRMLERLDEGGNPVTQALDDLELRDLIRRRRGQSSSGDDHYSFKHGLIGEVAYATLPRAGRRARHATVAEFLEGESRSGTEAEAILAYHWREAGNSEKAVRYLLSAAELAGRGWAKGEAVALYNQALELIPKDDPERRNVELRRAIDYAAFTHIDDARQARRAQSADATQRS
jgi:class 3 adenylate cyclase/energy-coupling factor transporter ATP-binding protein EcfA2